MKLFKKIWDIVRQEILGSECQYNSFSFFFQAEFLCLVDEQEQGGVAYSAVVEAGTAEKHVSENQLKGPPARC